MAEKRVDIKFTASSQGFDKVQQDVNKIKEGIGGGGGSPRGPGGGGGGGGGVTAPGAAAAPGGNGGGGFGYGATRMSGAARGSAETAASFADFNREYTSGKYRQKEAAAKNQMSREEAMNIALEAEQARKKKIHEKELAEEKKHTDGLEKMGSRRANTSRMLMRGMGILFGGMEVARGMDELQDPAKLRSVAYGQILGGGLQMTGSPMAMMAGFAISSISGIWESQINALMRNRLGDVGIYQPGLTGEQTKATNKLRNLQEAQVYDIANLRYGHDPTHPERDRPLQEAVDRREKEMQKLSGELSSPYGFAATRREEVLAQLDPDYKAEKDAQTIRNLARRYAWDQGKKEPDPELMRLANEMVNPKTWQENLWDAATGGENFKRPLSVRELGGQGSFSPPSKGGMDVTVDVSGVEGPFSEIVGRVVENALAKGSGAYR